MLYSSRFFKTISISCVILSPLFSLSPVNTVNAAVPVTGALNLVDPVIHASDGEGLTLTVSRPQAAAAETSFSRDVISLQKFKQQVADGQDKTIRGVYSQEGFALTVVQQPATDPGYVSTVDGQVTLFRLAARMKTTGLLAHNFAAGRHFSILKPGHTIQVIYGDGSIAEYAVTSIMQFRALQPYNPSTSLVDLQTNETLTAQQAFYKVYSGGHHLTLQTCISRDGNSSWGRLFVIAEPIQVSST